MVKFRVVAEPIIIGSILNQSLEASLLMVYGPTPTLYLESIRQQKNSRFLLVAEIANISLANQVTQKSTSEFKTSEKNWELSHLKL